MLRHGNRALTPIYAMTPILAFDIETIPDVAGIRKLHELPEDLPDPEVAEIAAQKRRVQTGDFLPAYLHRVVVISCVLRDDEGLRLFSIGEPEANEAAAIRRFFEGIDKYVPQIVSWNGRGFDLPVLVNRALQHSVGAACFWDNGRENQDFRFNNYINRFHDRHTDLMDALALRRTRLAARRRGAARRLSGQAGHPRERGVGELSPRRARRDPQLLRGGLREHLPGLPALPAHALRLDAARYAEECALVRSTLEKRPEPHWREFLSLWKS